MIRVEAFPDAMRNPLDELIFVVGFGPGAGDLVQDSEFLELACRREVRTHQEEHVASQPRILYRPDSKEEG
jgi:hypothetical protein